MSGERKTFIFVGQDILAASDGAAGEDGVLIPSDRAEALRATLTDAAPPFSRDYEWAGRLYRAVSLSEPVFASVAASDAVRDLAPRGAEPRRIPIRQAIGEYGSDLSRPLLRGLALVRWLETARHCGACGARLEDCPPERAGDGEGLGGRACPSCGRVFFPRISPAVIVLVHKDGKALLAHNAHFTSGRFGLIAGFVEAGEAIEETVAREVREEAGIEIRDLRYRHSQPWPFPDSLMLAFTAEWAGGEARPDGVEIAELRWCGPDELPAIPPPGSVARALIDEFVAQERSRADWRSK